MSGARISRCIALFAVALTAGNARAQSTPVFKKLDPQAGEPALVRQTPTVLSRSPMTFDVSASSDRKDIFTIDVNGVVWKRSLTSVGNPVRYAQTDSEPACAVLSSDSSHLAFADADGRVAVMDLKRKKISFQDSTSHERTVALTFSSTSDRLVSVTDRGTMRLWDTDTGELVDRREFAISPVQTVTFSPDGNRLAISSFSDKLTLLRWDRSQAGSVPEPKVLAAGARITACAFSPDGSQIVIARADGRTTVHNLKYETDPIALQASPFASWSIQFDPGSNRMATGRWDGTIQFWDTRSWKLIQSVKAHEESVASLHFADRGGLVSAGLDGRLLRWQPEAPSIGAAGVIEGRDDSVWVTVFSPDGKQMFVGGRKHRLELWDAETHTLRISKEGPPTTRCAAFSPDGQLLATGGDDRKIILWDAETMAREDVLSGHPGMISAVVFADEGRTLISVCDGGIVRLWDVDSREEKATWREHRQQAYCACLSPDEKWLVTGGGNWTTGDPGELLVWDLANGKLHKRLAGHKLAVWTIVFGRDGKYFAATDSSGDVIVWNTETLTRERTLKHSTWVRGLALSPAGHSLAVGQGDGSIRLWNTTTWTETATCNGHTSFTFALQFAPSGRTLVSSGEDGTVRFWNLDRN